MEVPYVHRRLTQPRSIRVLHLLPATNPFSPIACDLTEVLLDQRPEYCALSYAWDGQKLSSPIECGGRGLLVTPNCLAALRQLRDKDDVQTLWIDSICIDQTSLEERSQQVALMGDVYKQATRVVVWLGELDEGTAKAFKQIAEITDSQGFEAEEFQGELHRRVDRLKEETTKQSEDSMGAMFNRSWFGRLWTVQEVVLAQGDRIFFRCGNEILSWLKILMAVDALVTRSHQYGQVKKATQVLKYLSTMMMAKRYPGLLAILKDKPGHTVTEPHMSHILVYARQQASSDPKDRIFAFYGVLQELGFDIPSPDYNKSVQDIYREATVGAIKKDRILYLLTQAPSDHRLPGLSSWVPDWSEEGWHDADPRTALLYDRFCASGPADPKWRFSEDERRLILTGKWIDTVIYRTDVLDTRLEKAPLSASAGGIDLTSMSESFLQMPTSTRILKHWAEVSAWYAEYPTGETVKEALKRTLVQDYPRYQGDESFHEAFEAWYHLMASEEHEAGEATEGPGVAQLLNHLLPSWSEQARAGIQRARDRALYQKVLATGGGRAFQFPAMVFSNKKCFFTTENGYIGTASGLIQAEDRIAVVAGLSVPLILRPVEGDVFQLITHAYVHGVMYGDAWPGDEKELTDIQLV